MNRTSRVLLTAFRSKWDHAPAMGAPRDVRRGGWRRSGLRAAFVALLAAVFIAGQQVPALADVQRVSDPSTLPATFFVNVFEAERQPPGAVAAVVREIAQRGHEVGLHTHPSPALEWYDKPLFRKSRNEQVEILNPGHHICTLSEGGKFRMEMICQRGRGNSRQSERRRGSGDNSARGKRSWNSHSSPLCWV